MAVMHLLKIGVLVVCSVDVLLLYLAHASHKALTLFDALFASEAVCTSLRIRYEGLYSGLL